MSVHRVCNHGKWVYQARVAYRGLRRAAFRTTKDDARTAEGELLQALKTEHAQAEQEGSRLATTLRQLFEFYVHDPEDRGKGSDTFVRARATEHVLERLAQRAPGRVEGPWGIVMERR